jgi:hypothetical protein
MVLGQTMQLGKMPFATQQWTVIQQRKYELSKTTGYTSHFTLPYSKDSRDNDQRWIQEHVRIFPSSPLPS